MSFSEYVLQDHREGFICDVESHRQMYSYTRIPASVVLLIGPEGGFTFDEMNSAKKKGLNSLSLGPRVLRVETASIAALALLQNCDTLPQCL